VAIVARGSSVTPAVLDNENTSSTLIINQISIIGDCNVAEPSILFIDK
jgi:hypothetical protein